MNAAYPNDNKGLMNSIDNLLGSANIYIFLVLLVLILSVTNIAMHFIAKWDGHLHDTKGCTTLQGFHGKVFKVNSCDSSIVPIDSATYDYQKTPAETNTATPPQPQQEIKPPVPIKKPLPQKDPLIPPKTSPYMI